MSAVTISPSTIESRARRAGPSVTPRVRIADERYVAVPGRQGRSGSRQGRGGDATNGWRLTRRGVVAVVVGVLLAVTWILGELSGGIAVGEAVGSRPAGEAAAVVELVADAGRVMTVLPGDTIWSIAAREYPGTDPRAVVVAIRKANPALGDLWAGMSLRLPESV